MLDIDTLESLGFLRHARPQDLDSLRNDLRASPKRELLAQTRRLYSADAEDLAERGVLDLLGTVAPFLRHEGVPIEVVYRETAYAASNGRPAGRRTPGVDAEGWLDEGRARVQSVRLAFAAGAELRALTQDESGEPGYLLFAGDREIVIYSEAHTDCWSRAAQATIALLDELLAAHGSSERAHALGHDNDLAIVFATPEMARLLDAVTESPAARLHDGSMSR